MNPKVFLGDASFDNIQLYKSLLTDHIFGKSKHFSKTYTPLNSRSKLKSKNYTINKSDIPCCPNNEWNFIYKTRIYIERVLHHFKDYFGLAGKKFKTKKTLHADLLLSGITLFISILLTDKIYQHKYIRSIKSLII